MGRRGVLCDTYSSVAEMSQLPQLNRLHRMRVLAHRGYQLPAASTDVYRDSARELKVTAPALVQCSAVQLSSLRLQCN